MKKILVCGSSGFISTHLIKRLKAEGHIVYGLDRKVPEFSKNECDYFNLLDLRQLRLDFPWNEGIDECYQLAADMGGAGYLFTGEHDAEVLYNSAQINLNVLEACRHNKIPKVFFSSSACVYRDLIGSELGGLQIACREQDAYPATPDSEYGWEKLFAERLYAAFAAKYDIQVRIARLHNVFGTLGTWQGGREKAPAAICRKVAEAAHGTSITLWGDGTQQRSFMYVDDAAEGAVRLMASDFQGPVNIGSSRMVTLKELAEQIIAISTKWLTIEYEPGPIGVQGRNSDNTLIKEKLGWEPLYSLEAGLFATYGWVNQQVMKARGSEYAAINGQRVA